MNKKFKHPATIYNGKAAQEIVPFLIDLLSPDSVIDVGCGIGTWLKSFKEKGIQTVLGIDGAYHEKDIIAENLSNTEFLEVNLEDNYQAILDVLHAKHQAGTSLMFDLAISLEVGEHLHEKFAESYIHLLTSLSHCILFSAAIPKQGGDGHVNEQWPEYWKIKFKEKGYQMWDIIRPVFWNNQNIDVWYRQNMLLFVKEDMLKDLKQTLIKNNRIEYPVNIVHPELFISKTTMRYGVRSSLNILLSAILRRLKL